MEVFGVTKFPLLTEEFGVEEAEEIFSLELITTLPAEFGKIT